MEAARDYYKILNVDPISKPDDIKMAYRQLSKKYHPDLNPDMKIFSDDKMKQLVEAYNAVSTEDKRKTYDNQPQFQLRRSKRAITSANKASASAYTAKPKFQREQSFLERLISPFTKKTETANSSVVDTKQADVHFTLALSMAENASFYDQAINEFKVSIKFQPEFPEALYDCGILLYRLGKFEDAVVYFQKVLYITKNDPYAAKMISLLRDEFE